jgi:hypothetical protein
MSEMTAPPEFSSARRIRYGIDRALEDAAAGRFLEVLRASADDPRTGVYVVRFLESIPGVGKVAARRLAAEMGHDGFTRVWDLSVAEREELVVALEDAP